MFCQSHRCSVKVTDALSKSQMFCQSHRCSVKVTDVLSRVTVVRIVKVTDALLESQLIVNSYNCQSYEYKENLDKLERLGNQDGIEEMEG